MSASREEFELDDEMRAAFEALEAAVPAGYFDDFDNRLQARLERQAMNEIAEQTSDEIDPATPLGEDAIDAIDADAANAANAANADDDGAELSGIRELAAKTKESVSMRLLAIEEPEDEEPLMSAVSLALKTISLPEPGKDFKVFAGNEKSTGVPVAAREDEGGLPTWIWAGISAALAAAIVFFLLRADKRDENNQVAMTTPPPPPPVMMGGAEPDTQDGLRPDENPGQPDRMSNTGGMPGAAETADDTRATNPDDTIDDSNAAGSGDGSADGSETNTSGQSANRSGSNTTRSPGGSVKATRSRAAARKKSDTSDDADTTTATKPPAEDKAAPEPEKKKDTLESLLAEASAGAGGDDANKNEGAGTGTTAPKDAPKKPARKELDRRDVKKAMSAVQGKTRACYDKYKQTGMVMIKFVVQPTGKVTEAKATRDFAGTDTGKCVAKVVESASFPEFSGPQQSFSYAFLLSQ